MGKETNVIKYYVLCNKLKNLIRTGWKNWHVNRERLESVAEHIFGVQMLAIAMKSEYQYDIDILKVIMMLSVHELEEIIIGDLTLFDIENEDKIKIGHEAVQKILADLFDQEYISNLILEFDAKETKEAKFAFYCDKLECDLQCKLYDEEGCVNLNNQEGNKAFNNNRVRELLEKGFSWSDMWLEFDRETIGFDENFLTVSNYVSQNNISKL